VQTIFNTNITLNFIQECLKSFKLSTHSQLNNVTKANELLKYVFQYNEGKVFLIEMLYKSKHLAEEGAIIDLITKTSKFDGVITQLFISIGFLSRSENDFNSLKIPNLETENYIINTLLKSNTLTKISDEEPLLIKSLYIADKDKLIQEIKKLWAGFSYLDGLQKENTIKLVLGVALRCCNGNKSHVLFTEVGGVIGRCDLINVSIYNTTTGDSKSVTFLVEVKCKGKKTCSLLKLAVEGIKQNKEYGICRNCPSVA
jgi:hypothetical protein